MLDPMVGGARDVVGSVVVPVPILTTTGALERPPSELTNLLALTTYHRCPPFISAGYRNSKGEGLSYVKHV